MKKKTTVPTKEGIYAFVFVHGKMGEREIARIQGKISGVETITDDSHLKSMESFLQQNYVNPVITSWTLLRTEDKVA